MDVREIRVGNLLYDGKKVYEVDIWAFVDDRERGYFYKGLKPIPLTEQWLLDFGFENGNKEMSNCDLWDKWWIGDFVLDKEPDDGFWFYFHNGSAKVHYVHQLQNLFYALTNKELIKSK